MLEKKFILENYLPKKFILEKFIPEIDLSPEQIIIQYIPYLNFNLVNLSNFSDYDQLPSGRKKMEEDKNEDSEEQFLIR